MLKKALRIQPEKAMKVSPMFPLNILAFLRVTDLLPFLVDFWIFFSFYTSDACQLCINYLEL